MDEKLRYFLKDFLQMVTDGGYMGGVKRLLEDMGYPENEVEEYLNKLWEIAEE